MTLVPGDYVFCQRSVQYFVACYEDKNEKINLHASHPSYINKQILYIAAIDSVIPLHTIHCQAFSQYV